MGSKFTFGYLYNFIKKSFTYTTLDTRSIATASTIKEMVGFSFPEISEDVLEDIATKFMFTEVNNNHFLMYVFTDADIPVSNSSDGTPRVVRNTRYCGSNYTIVLRDAKINSLDNVVALSRYIFEEILSICMHTENNWTSVNSIHTGCGLAFGGVTAIMRRMPSIVMTMRLMTDVVIQKSYSMVITIDDIVNSVQIKDGLAGFKKFHELMDFRNAYIVEKMIIESISEVGDSVEYLLDNTAIFKTINTCIDKFSVQYKKELIEGVEAAKQIKHEDVKSISNEITDPIDADPAKRKVSSGRIRKGKES